MKIKTLYVCTNCGTTAPKWMGRCTSCGAWNSFVEEAVEVKPKGKGGGAVSVLPETIVTLETLKDEHLIRHITPDEELNRVLGGGLVPGSVTLLGGEPGIGKSTALLQLAMTHLGRRILYVSGEESLPQVKLRASRLGLRNEDCYFITETTLEHIIGAAKKVEPELVIIDSIQTISSLEVESAPGSVPQIRECTAGIIGYAKKNNVAVFLIGHITKDGNIAGPKILEHMVDTVLYFEGDRHYNYRILRTMKNRFGSAQEIGIYEMRERGLHQVKNPSEILLTTRQEGLSGIAIGSMLEGIRPMLIEVQALVTPSVYGNPQRTATGFDGKRLSMLLAVLEKRCGLKTNIFDVFLNIAGGLRVEDPAIDLAVAVSLASSYNDMPVPLHCAFAGEVGLSGEIRPAGQIEARIKEAEKLGFKKLYISAFSEKSVKADRDIQLVFVPTLQDALAELFG